MNHPCPVNQCREAFQNFSDLQRHLLTNHGQRWIPCHAPECDGKLFPSRDALNKHHHRRHHHDRRCAFCPPTRAPFNGSDELYQHVVRDHRMETGRYEAPEGGDPLPPTPSRLVRLEQLVAAHPGRIIDEGPFLTVYDDDGMHPVFVLETLGPRNLDYVVGDRSGYEEPYVDDPFLGFRQVTPEAIRSTPYDLGHLAGARFYRYAEADFRATFQMRNIVPQIPSLNSGLLNAGDSHIMDLLRRGWRLTVMTIPVYTPRISQVPVIGGYDLPIPTWIFKIIWMQRQGEEPRLQIFRFLQERAQVIGHIFAFRSTLEETERETGVRFQPGQPPITWDVPATGYVCGAASCHLTFLTQSQRSNHERVTHDNVYRCKHCDRMFQSSQARQEHIVAHHPRYECDVCGSTFETPFDLKRHRRSHTGERPFQCPHCEKRFTDSSALTQHVRIHTGEKPYKCGGCNYSASQSSELTRHCERYGHPRETP